MNQIIETEATKKNKDEHPCFSSGAQHTVARVHLPVAPRCNIQCGFCNRSYDCVNESRPGVTSKVLEPDEALDYLVHVRSKLPSLGVVGIAGPGDPLANKEASLATLRRVAKEHPDLKLCLSTNGLGLPEAVDELVAMGVNHLTVTVNAVDPEIGAMIYPWVRSGGRALRGIEGARALLQAQEAGIRGMKAHGVTIKINMIAIPGVNTHHLPEVARVCQSWGADLANVLALIPVENTLFDSLKPIRTKDFAEVKNQVSTYLPLMTHCARCRADAVGLIGKDEKLLENYESQESCCSDMKEIIASQESSSSPKTHSPKEELREKKSFSEEGISGGLPFRVAVTTREGFLVNAHLGEADDLWIYEQRAEQWEFLEKRPAPHPGAGFNRWTRLAQILGDCQIVFVGGVGPNPRQVLEGQGIRVWEVEGTIHSVLEEYGQSGTTGTHQKRTVFSCGSECQGNGGGCG